MNKALLKSVVVLAATMSLAASASAATLTATWTNDNTTLPATDYNPTPSIVGVLPLDKQGTFTTTAQGSVPAVQSSPWGNSTSYFSCIDCTATQPPGGQEMVVYDAPANTTTFSILWGSPDAYNTLTFVDSSGDTYAVTGNELGVPTGTGFDWVTFTASGDISSVELYDNGTAAFEYADPTFTPVPAALPLFAGGLGMIGLLGRRRKRKGASVLPA
jgi:hypothetical protein